MNVLFIVTAHPVLWNSLMEHGYDCVYDENFSSSNYEQYLADAEGIVVRSKIKLTAAVLAKAPMVCNSMAISSRTTKRSLPA